MSRASESALDALHELVAKVLQENLVTVTEPVLDKDGNKVGEKVIPPSPQMIAQAIKFLKDNGIDAPVSSKRFTDLAAALDDLNYEDIGATNLTN